MGQQIKDSKHSSGQVALVMVLIMTVVSAVVVSVAGRVTTETRVQQLSKDSADAFLTAQSGLEEAILKKESLSGGSGDNREFRVTLTNTGQEGLITDPVLPGSSLDIVLNASPLLQGFRVYWKPLTASASSLYISKSAENEIVDLAYNQTGADGFTRVSGGGLLNSVEFPYVTPQITLDVNVKRIRIAVYGGSAVLGIEPIGDLLPVQTLTYKAEGVVGGGETEVRYGLNYEESADKKLPEVFDYALFSFGSIIQ